MEYSRPARSARSTVLASMLLLGLLLGMAWTVGIGGGGQNLVVAQAVPFDCSTIVTNGDFESPTLTTSPVPNGADN